MVSNDRERNSIVQQAQNFTMQDFNQNHPGFRHSYAKQSNANNPNTD